jgi:hypothetical protein
MDAPTEEPRYGRAKGTREPTGGRSGTVSALHRARLASATDALGRAIAPEALK